MFVLDTCWLIEAWENVYPPSIFPSLWGRISKAMQTGDVVLLKVVLGEIQYGDDLVCWCREQPTVDCCNNQNVAKYLKDISDFLAQSKKNLLSSPNRQKNLTSTQIDQAIMKFANGADIFIVAYASACDGIIITTEKDRKSFYYRGQICLPYVAQHFTVRCVPAVEMFRQLGFQF